MKGNDLLKVIMQESRNAGYFQTMGNHALQGMELRSKSGIKRKLKQALREEKECLEIVIIKSQKRLIQIKTAQQLQGVGCTNETI